MAMPQTKTLRIAEALVRKIRAIAPAGPWIEVEVVRTQFRRFDADTTTGLKVYVASREDVQGKMQDGGDRGHDVYLHTFTISVVDRITADVIGFDAKECWVDQRIDFVTSIRDALDEAREYDLYGGVEEPNNPVAGLDLIPTSTGPREICDLDWLNEKGVFLSEFDHVIREG